MKNGQSEHWNRINARVMRRILSDLPQDVHDIIAADFEGRTPESKWFNEKVVIDTNRLYLDPNYYDNEPYTFRYSR